MFDSPVAVKEQVTTAPILRKNFKSKEGKFSVKIRVTYRRTSKYYSIQHENRNLQLSEEDFDEIMNVSSKLKAPKKQIREVIFDTMATINRQISAINRSGIFSFDRLDKAIVYKPKNGFLSYFREYQALLMKKNQISTHETNKSALNSLVKFIDNKDIHPSEINLDFLLDFEAHIMKPKMTVSKTGELITRSGKMSTVGIYMRAIRAVYNYAIQIDAGLEDSYPFTSKSNEVSKYRIRSGGGKKGDALTLEEFKKFKSLHLVPHTPEWIAHQTWLFLFYCQGMNITDFGRLKTSNVTPDRLSYIRHKTHRTEYQTSSIEIPISDEIRHLMKNLRSSSQTQGDYLFDILSPNLSPIQELALIKQRTKTVNKWLKKICIENNLPPVTTYWARHSYATIRYIYLGHSAEAISEDLDHSSLRTTQAYLSRFNLDSKRIAQTEMSRLLA